MLSKTQRIDMIFNLNGAVQGMFYESVLSVHRMKYNAVVRRLK